MRTTIATEILVTGLAVASPLAAEGMRWLSA
jgi:hypothetical protein